MRPRKLQRDLPACMYYKHGAYYYVKKGKWLNLGTDLHHALAAYASKQGQRKGGMPQLIDDVLTHISPNLAPSTRKHYKGAAAKLKTYLAEFDPAQVLPRDVAAIKVDMVKTPNMANRCLSLLTTVFAQAVEWQLVDSNPCLGIKRHSEAKRSRYMTDSEYSAIRAHAGPRLQIIMDLCYLTGQRIGDVLAIRRADLTADGIRFRQGKTKTTLTVVWTPALEAVVAEAKALNKSLAAFTLLHNRKGKAPDYSTVKIQWDKARTAAGVPDVTIHDLRAKSLTDAKREGFDPTALAGHANKAMTERYIRLRESPLVKGPSIRQSIDSNAKTA
jgi:integrase